MLFPIEINLTDVGECDQYEEITCRSTLNLKMFYSKLTVR